MGFFFFDNDNVKIATLFSIFDFVVYNKNTDTEKKYFNFLILINHLLNDRRTLMKK